MCQLLLPSIENAEFEMARNHFFCVVLLSKCPQRGVKHSSNQAKSCHAFDFCLKVVERDPITNEEVYCHDKFCIHYGREAKVDTKEEKSPTVNILNNHSEWTITRAT